MRTSWAVLAAAAITIPLACQPAPATQAPMTPASEVPVSSVTPPATAPSEESSIVSSPSIPPLPPPAPSASSGPLPKPSAASPSGTTAPFDRGAAARALGSVNVQSCAGQGVSGSGHVTVTFDPSGQVSSAIVDAGPYPGTPAGSCIAGRFRAATVPPFGGAPTRVGKSFTLP